MWVLMGFLLILVLPGVAGAQTTWSVSPPSGDVRLNGLQFPTTDGTIGQAITTNGAGVLGFSTVAGTGTVTHTGGLTPNAPVVGNGADDIKVVSFLPNTVGGTGVDSAGFTGLALITAGTWSAYGGTTPCSAGDFIVSLNASGVATCATPAGGGNVNAGATLTANQLVLGAGSTNVAVLGSLGTATTVLHGNAGGAPSFAAVNLANDVTGSLALSSIASQANNTILSNISGGAASPSANTLTAILDSVLGTTQGSIIYRNATVWTTLAPGTSGNVLTTQGAAANPIWGAVGGGTVTTTGSPVSGNLTKFSGATSITNGDLTGDVTTSGALVTTLSASGVAAGIYGQVQVDTKGRVIAGTIITDVSHGGTGNNVLAANNLLVGNGTSPLTLLPPGGPNTVLHGTASPSWSRVALGAGVNTSGDIIGNLPVANLNSGTGASSSTFWRGDGTWASVPATPGLPFTSIQFNNAGAFGGDVNAVWDNTAKAATIKSVYTKGEPVFDVKAYGAKGDGATDDTAAITAAIAAVPATGGRVYFPPGTYKTSGTITMNKPGAFEGSGLGTTVLMQSTAATLALDVTVSQVGVRNLTIDRSVNATAGGTGLRADVAAGIQYVQIEQVRVINQFVGIILGNASYAWVRDVVSENNNSHGVQFSYPVGGTVQWELFRVLSEKNLGAGFSGVNSTASNGIGPLMVKTSTFANNLGGYVFQATAGNSINDLELLDALASGDNTDGIFLDTRGTNHVVRGVLVELAGQIGSISIGSARSPVTMTASNTGYGLNVTANNDAGGIVVAGSTFSGNSYSGALILAAGVSVTGSQFNSNGRALNANADTRAGITVKASSVVVSGNAFTAAVGELAWVRLNGTAGAANVGINSYAFSLPESSWVTTAGTPPTGGAQLAAGAYIKTNIKPLSIVDPTSGAPNSKHLQETGGTLAILNSAFTSNLFTLDDTGNVTMTASSGLAVIAAAGGTIGANIALQDNAGGTPAKWIRSFNNNFEMLNSAYTTLLLRVTDTGTTTLPAYAGVGNAALCVNAAGIIFRGAPGC